MLPKSQAAISISLFQLKYLWKYALKANHQGCTLKNSRQIKDNSTATTGTDVRLRPSRARHCPQQNVRHETWQINLQISKRRTAGFVPPKLFLSSWLLWSFFQNITCTYTLRTQTSMVGLCRQVIILALGRSLTISSLHNKTLHTVLIQRLGYEKNVA